MVSTKKKVRAVVEVGPNYICHLMAVARLGFDSDYADRYLHSVRAEDLDWLQEHQHLLQWSDGHAGVLSQLVFFVANYIGLHTRKDLERFFKLLIAGLENEDYAPFLNAYKRELENLKAWMYTVDEKWLAMFAPYLAQIDRLREIYIGNFAKYLDHVWPHECDELCRVANKLNSFFADKDIIHQWEIRTGREFKFSEYQIVLCSAIKNGPNANSLGYERNIFYHGSDFEWLTQFISHEIGTHILIDIFPPFDPHRTREEFDILYRGYENLCRFYNSLILDQDIIYSMSHRYHGEEFHEIYSRIYHDNPSLDAKELYQLGVSEFRRICREG